jgi:hypothetical protein
MRRAMSLVAAAMLVASVASSSLAAAPPNANRFVGDFDIVDFDLTTVIGHVHAKFSEPTEGKLVPGTIDIYWAGGQVRETHMQLVDTDFGEQEWQDPYSPTGWFQATYAQAVGSRCDYRGVRDASCEPFAMIFQQITEPAVSSETGPWRDPSGNKVGFSVSGSQDCCGGDWYVAAMKGAWALTYVNPTNP